MQQHNLTMALNTRIITATILIIIFAAGVVLLPTIWLALLLGIVPLFGIVEWLKLAGFKNYQFKIILLSICTLLMLLFLGLILHAQNLTLATHLISIALMITVLWWLLTTWRIYKIKTIKPQNKENLGTVLLGTYILLTTWSSMVWLHTKPHGPWLLLFLLILIWIADIGAFFAGRRWGHVKLAPLLSPSKTREGVYGAMIGAVLWSGILASYYGTTISEYLGLILLCLVILCLLP